MRSQMTMRGDVLIQRRSEDILGWPTDTFSIDFTATTTNSRSSDPNVAAAIKAASATTRNITPPHTVIVFVPGNPGLVEWYITFFAEILESLGPGYAVRGASYAGHSTDPNKINVEDATTANNNAAYAPTTTTTALAWTIEGQVRHKIAYIDKFTKQLSDNNIGGSDDATAGASCKLILMGHSIGCHLVQRILVLRSDDILQRTIQCIFLMPFIRMDAPFPNQQVLDWASHHPDTSTWILQNACRLLARLPHSETLMRDFLLKSMMERPEDRMFTAKLLRQTAFPRNFLGLGLEEIRDVPQAVDVFALRYITIRNSVPVAILFAGNDHWAPEFHIQDLQSLIHRGVLNGDTLALKYNPALKHDFITANAQTSFVVDYCIELIQKQQQQEQQSTKHSAPNKDPQLRSKL